MDNKKIAIMQPYLFPYIGYFQLIKSVDLFVFYNDVNYIKQGWINRNKILLNGKEFSFSAPVSNVSSFRKIKDTKIHKDLFPIWRSKFLRTIEQAYSKAPYYVSTKEMIADVLFKPYLDICSFAVDSNRLICSYLGINTEFKLSSEEYPNNHLSASDRIVDICFREQARIYINPPGGLHLYDKNSFNNVGLNLYFLIPNLSKYNQFGNPFVPWLSIIDVLMFNSVFEINCHLNNYELS
ncbi:MAG: WbqC family protein [Leptospiraceae bacterium]|nr:WbqC family protein [Leptospiraceae bacterium]